MVAKKIKLLICCSLPLLFSTFVFGQDFYSFNSKQDAERFDLLTQQIRCVVCQNQNLADSNAPLANDLREKIYYMVRANQSNEKIKEYLIARYGEFILLQPRMNANTFVLWFFPLIGLLVAFILILRSVKRTSQ